MIQKIRQELKARFLEREDLIDGALAALLCGEHVMIIGPPGTAKSMLAHEICNRFTEARYFHWLLTKFTTPEELFGPVSLKGLENDQYYRITDNKLPTAHVAFLDEVFKSSSSILNTLLTLINERKFFNGDKSLDVPLITLFGATNDVPQAEELRALYDRFLLRFKVGYLSDEANFRKMLSVEEEHDGTYVPLKTLYAAQKEVANVAIPEPIITTLATLRAKLNEMEIEISDRRYKQCLGPLRAHAWLRGQKEVVRENLDILKSILWNSPDEREKVADIIDAFIFPLEQRAAKFLAQAEEVKENLRKTYAAEHEKKAIGQEAMYKIGKLAQRLNDLISIGAGSTAEPRLKDMRQQFMAISSEIEKHCAGLSDARS